MVTDRDARSLTALGENGEPAATKVFTAAKEELAATILNADRLAAEENLKPTPDRQPQLEMLKSQLRRQCVKVLLAHKLVCEEKNRFQEVKARFAKELSGADRQAVTAIGKEVEAGGTITERSAEFLQKVGIGEKYATEVLAGKLGSRGVEKILDK